uniref:Uncharacterized protein n=1 Tax=Myoviridae sp. ctitt1 TaxID=2825157 RepID=A0A8S5QL24_9CAUD|nr:MAG TPA: hypothetical protein [Myoviridae sp. ctitt1]
MHKNRASRPVFVHLKTVTYKIINQLALIETKRTHIKTM